jgi:hypothetical protein
MSRRRRTAIAVLFVWSGLVPGAAPLPDDVPGPGESASFQAPADLDGKGRRDWGKVAEKVHDGDLGEALHKLREFERKHGTSPESVRLRAWLERQPGYAED